MKKSFFGLIGLAVAFGFIIPTMARSDVSVDISLPPVVVFASSPEMVVFPDTDIYVVPDVGVDLFFYEGWWWRPWEGRWYRSRDYGSGWGYYDSVPSFYRQVPSGWRNDYREHRWQGHAWNYQRMPHQQVESNWSGWEKSGHWKQQNDRSVQNAPSRPTSRAAVKAPRPVQSSRAAQPAPKVKRSRKVKRTQNVQPARNEQPAREVQPAARQEQPAQQAQPAREEQRPSEPNRSGGHESGGEHR